jgi:hypothetical protein
MKRRPQTLRHLLGFAICGGGAIVLLGELLARVLR